MMTLAEMPSQPPPADAAAPRLSVCICTHNGARRLPVVLDCLAAQTAPAAGWELIVIDNASTDDTAAVAAAALRPFGPGARVVAEPEPGLSFARRRAALEACGELICFLDDDNLPDPDYVEQVIRAFDAHPQAGSIGGKVVADWETEPSALVRAVEGYALAIVDLGDTPFVYDWVAHGPVGAGLCIRRHLLLDALNDPVLCGAVTGRRGASLVSGEDMALAVKVFQAGYERRYEPALRLRHRLPAERMTGEYLGRLCEGIGRGQTAVRRLWARRGHLRATVLLVGLKDFLLWLRGTVLGPRQAGPAVLLTRAAGTDSPELRRELHTLEQRLLWGRVADALEFGFSKSRRRA